MLREPVSQHPGLGTSLQTLGGPTGTRSGKVFGATGTQGRKVSYFRPAIHFYGMWNYIGLKTNPIAQTSCLAHLERIEAAREARRPKILVYIYIIYCKYM